VGGGEFYETEISKKTIQRRRSPANKGVVVSSDDWDA